MFDFSKIEVGNAVLIKATGYGQHDAIGIVDRVTATRFSTKNGDTFNKRTGYRVGERDRFYRVFVARIATEEDRKAVAHERYVRQCLQKIEHLATNKYKLKPDTVVKIAEFLDGLGAEATL